MLPLESLAQPAWRRFLIAQRWYGAKSREIDRVRVADAAWLAGPENAGGAAWAWALLEVFFREGPPHTYHLPALALDREGKLVEDLAGPELCRWLAEGFEKGKLKTSRASLIFSDSPFRNSREYAEGPLFDLNGHTVSVLPGEMSNSLLRMGPGALLKIYRRAEPGAHPEVEAMEILSRNRFPNAPRLFGTVHYLPGGGDDLQERYALMLLMEGLPEGWSLWDLYTRRGEAARSAEEGPSGEEELASLSEELGEATALLHRALQDPVSDKPESAPPAGFDEDLRVLESLERALPRLSEDARRLGEKVLARSAEIRRKLSEPLSAENRPVRVHGDYHLGQVFLTRPQRRLVIFDFEGEPARDLASRRLPWPAARDVGCLLRSFSYAGRLGGWRGGREEVLGRRFLEGYWSGIQGAPFVPGAASAFLEAVRVFELGKALAEILYEMTHRPDWVAIPLSGVLEILDRKEGRRFVT